jgi:hypothetical protein
MLEIQCLTSEWETRTPSPLLRFRITLEQFETFKSVPMTQAARTRLTSIENILDPCSLRMLRSMATKQPTRQVMVSTTFLISFTTEAQTVAVLDTHYIEASIRQWLSDNTVQALHALRLNDCPRRRCRFRDLKRGLQHTKNRRRRAEIRW